MKRWIAMILILINYSALHGASDQYNLNDFLNYKTDQRVKYFESLSKNAQLGLLNEFIPNRCFCFPIDDAIVFDKNGDIHLDWLKDAKNGRGLVLSSREIPEIKDMVAYKWKLTDRFIISKGKDYDKLKKIIGSVGDMLFDLDEKETIEFDKIKLSNFQDNLCVTLSNKNISYDFNETSFTTWNFSSKYSTKKQSNENIDSPYSTAGENESLTAELKKLDGQLNAVYSDLSKMLNAEQKQSLVTSQKEWLEHRDNEFAFIESQVKGLEGTMYPNIVLRNKVKIIKDRVSELGVYLMFFKSMQ
jgi:uncharacterized protein YecT (DUF1311 family)